MLANYDYGSKTERTAHNGTSFYRIAKSRAFSPPDYDLKQFVSIAIASWMERFLLVRDFAPNDERRQVEAGGCKITTQKYSKIIHKDNASAAGAQLQARDGTTNLGQLRIGPYN